MCLAGMQVLFVVGVPKIHNAKKEKEKSDILELYC